jgi:hypothetical protein
MAEYVECGVQKMKSESLVVASTDQGWIGLGEFHVMRRTHATFYQGAGR